MTSSESRQKKTKHKGIDEVVKAAVSKKTQKYENDFLELPRVLNV